MNQAEGIKVAPVDSRSEVLSNTGAKLRKFLYELAEGTRDYRSLHNLTEQVEHQYHGRFVVELIQNAHDALNQPSVNSDSHSRIEFSLRSEGPHGVLYVANDGRPFSKSNFESLSQLGNSDKNPQESIGNKGIGFRSVLEITNRPEIYSRSGETSQSFDGYCFRFSPNEIRQLITPILKLHGGDDTSEWDVSEHTLVDWEVVLIEKFRRKLSESADVEGVSVRSWLEKELQYLSPYMLPIPVEEKREVDAIVDYQRRGFSSVIRLPLKSESALELARQQMKSVESNSLIFLSKVSELVLSTDDGWSRSYVRRASDVVAESGTEDVQIDPGNGHQVKKYRVWTRELILSDAAENVRESLEQLPGKWGELKGAPVSVAVRVGGVPESGKLSIFLPTLINSGCWAHINAPFYGDMSRTLIDFGTLGSEPESAAAVYNRFLLSYAAKLSIQAITKGLVGKAEVEGNAIVDLLSSNFVGDESSKRWQIVLEEAATSMELKIPEEPWMLSNKGWVPLNKISLLPDCLNAQLVTQNLLSDWAVFPYFTEAAESRREQIERLSGVHGFSSAPLIEGLAESIELVAQNLHSNGKCDWNSFWSDIDVLLKGDFKSLKGRRVLIGNDGDLHATGDNSKVFFSPRQGMSEDEEVENEGDVKDIPESLRPYVAFLGDEIRVYEGTSGRQETRLRKLLLGAKIVSRFRREDIFNEILLPRTPALPVKHRAKSELICRDILQWGLQLLTLLLDRGKGDSLFPLLERLPAPCVGGWYPLCETSFGPGWHGTHGDVVDTYLSSVKSIDCLEARGKLLMPPDSKKWGQSGIKHLMLLRKAGVFDGLRLTFIKPDLWTSQFSGSRNDILLPRGAPPNCSAANWAEYRNAANLEAEPSYNHGVYRLFDLNLLPGVDGYSEFNEDTRIAFMNAIMVSAASWPANWGHVRINRVQGNPDSFHLKSYILWSLARMEWLGSEDENGITWSRPAERWYVPTEVSAGRRHHFSHLRPLSGNITDRLHRNPALIEFLEKLGMPRYNLEIKDSSKRLLEALIESAENGTVENYDVFLGQVRDAWSVFEPEDQLGAFPRKLLVQRKGSDLRIQVPTEEEPVYLPDFAKFLGFLRDFDLPILAIDTRDAKRLSDGFNRQFPDSVILTSSLNARPIVNGESSDISEGDLLRDDEMLSWLPPVLLTIAAFHGARASGTASKVFQKQIHTFRNARVSIVGDLKIQLYQDGNAVGQALPSIGYWDQELQNLFLIDFEGDELGLVSASESFESMLGRDDLVVPIKLMLIKTGDHYDMSKVSAGLSDLGISEDQYREVLEYWRGDVKLYIEWLIPVIMLLRPDAQLGELIESRSEEDITKFLSSVIDDVSELESLRGYLRSSNDMFDFGFNVYGDFGEQVELSLWNEAMEDQQLASLANRDYSNQFQSHLNSMLLHVRCLLAYVLHQNPKIGHFAELYGEIRSFDVPSSLEFAKWEVGFSDVLILILPQMKEWDPALPLWDAVSAVSSIEEFADKLDDQGIRLDSDPLQIRLINREKLTKALRELQLTGLAWSVAQELPNASVWEGKWESYYETLNPLFEPIAYLEELQESDIWLLLMELDVESGFSDFFDAISRSSGIEELRAILGVSNDQLLNAVGDLQKLREEVRRKDRFIDVCGEAFDSAPDNLGELWRHINDSVSTGSLSSLGEINFRKTQDLDKLVKRTNRKNGGTTGATGRASFPKVTKSMEQLIGLSGEIHAFRRLQDQYGKDVVNASSWVSSYSATIGLNSEADTDDGMGCDFKITSGGATYYIEVKSSQGVQESFKMGSSEIRLATELAKKHVRGVYLILKVNEALSDTPTFDLLPNPYDPRHEALFELVEADARIRYKSSGS